MLSSVGHRGGLLDGSVSRHGGRDGRDFRGGQSVRSPDNPAWGRWHGTRRDYSPLGSYVDYVQRNGDDRPERRDREQRQCTGWCGRCREFLLEYGLRKHVWYYDPECGGFAGSLYREWRSFRDSASVAG